MNFLYYQYSLSDFVKVDDYKLEYFTKESNLEFFYKTILDNIKTYTQMPIPEQQDIIKRIYIPKEEIIKYLNSEKRFFTYDPLNDTPELYLELNKINIWDEKSVMKFINNYGIPFNYSIQENNEHFNSNLSFINDVETVSVEMNALLFFQRLVIFQQILRMWNDIVEENTEIMTSIKHEFEELATFNQRHQSLFREALSSEEYADYIFNDSKIFFRGGEMKKVYEAFKGNPDKLLELNKIGDELNSTWERVKDETDIKTIAFTYLNLKLKDLEAGETATRVIDGKIVPAMKFNNLLEVASFQLKQAIFKDLKLEECINCGALFEPIHGSQKFCSPLPGRKRSTCENTYNQRKKRERKNMKESRKK
ncbi:MULTISPECIES: hypothetical protein [Bacillaceae]|uniref:Uncharacterized protein n=1 Tax=Oceanobacillus caeni TaxID=405946 RepID=A0ABR5MI42_9BACI|nr:MULTISPECIES: hypothetical protein [Bacillaceae]KPH73854.1 hypothetical protein AFL42_11345 [Oceanobacillus caeni]MED4476072.1 hypothetical protein [Oceanobacillus caeni]